MKEFKKRRVKMNVKVNTKLIEKYLKELELTKKKQKDKDIIKMLLEKGLSRREIYYCFPPSKSINSINSSIAQAKAEIERENFYKKNKHLYMERKNK